MKQLEVQIMQQSYLLGCPEGREARLLEAVERVDTAMTAIRDAGKVRARERIAVLAALNLAFDLADREAEELERAAASPAAQQSLPGTDSLLPAQLSGNDSERLEALVKRLDDALGADGRLF
ncbi:cell division protein ZapA [Simplicispira suum]|jgi:cell division protein ZapA|uniref:Cell division protein ZapA n=1 Tax=Simplicispira suum TaxID=2109915 RepID=A0A2S0N4B7_9BURK|nr:cell division protein ZapA [Simplicispira suum]AVO42956.1 cell division protein ZapA [Simplicispira suum]MBW7833225.1 cell division protein ZapA [Simplicispira suum]MCB1980138.1 cell division protein ZapA [Burkholderiaceae bacterium]MCO5104000.1 cell division protein ZapA [Burkholderiaceae bacterium]